MTNDLKRSAVEIGQLYKGRWQIELLFRWIKQHLKIRKFLGNNDNAVRLQLFAALIAYALLRIAGRACRVAMPILRFTDLVTRCLFERRNIAAIDKPPPVNPSQRKPNSSPNQMCFSSCCSAGSSSTSKPASSSATTTMPSACNSSPP
ncbi:hypothetical protein X729_31035 [Mesorhizobium sp. L103C131B0]|nr:hypothetical protein X729_31035 [Mesorhizobium sp. L103C131B0]